LKLECENPTRTQKDRAAASIVQECLKDGSLGVTVGTCGNFGVSLSYYAALSKLPCRIFVPEEFSGKRLGEINSYGSRITVLPGGYEDAVEGSQRFADTSGFFDANPPGRGGRIALRAYEQIAIEILDKLSETPLTVWVPVGNGTTIAGVYRGFVRRNRNPRMGAVGSLGNTAATASIARRAVIELPPSSLRRTTINEPLVNWRSYHAAEALHTILSSDGLVFEATDQELDQATKRLRNSEHVTASAAAALAGLQSLSEGEISPGGSHVLIITG
jgi:threonine synthase